MLIHLLASIQYILLPFDRLVVPTCVMYNSQLLHYYSSHTVDVTVALIHCSCFCIFPLGETVLLILCTIVVNTYAYLSSLVYHRKDEIFLNNFLLFLYSHRSGKKMVYFLP